MIGYCECQINEKEKKIVRACKLNELQVADPKNSRWIYNEITGFFRHPLTFMKVLKIRELAVEFKTTYSSVFLLKVLTHPI